MPASVSPIPLPPALNSLPRAPLTPAIRWDRVEEARGKIARGDYDDLADTELVAKIAAAMPDKL